ncbi:glycosyl transferase [Thioclava sp. SK-1]|uniref:glycosyltransferase family 2 protein n=1 Tax=Thioclava sp. SK-1 TaxID=1889770 RepID=UPI000825ED16|nr:glycosyltransferase [Thioclava sp. SK-1]OCX66808.1 glycosyl transferase [Thioclava sp. SK-1]
MPIEISCIIPAYNEAPRIARVLEAVLCHPGLSQVIVVDDGSSDDTAEVVARYPSVRLIRQANMGKTAAVAAGLRAATSSHVLLLDSDLAGLTGVHVSQLLAPVMKGRADVAISLRRNAPLLWRLIGLDYISGERVLPRALLQQGLNGLPSFGLEVHMNRAMIHAGLRLAVVSWPEVESPFKHAKLGSWAKGLKADAKMLRDMFRTVSVSEAGAQIFSMRRMRIPTRA